VALLYDGALGAGPHTFPLDGSALPSEVYVIRVTARAVGGHAASATKRFTLAR
jgi:hypothetical protein